MPRFLTGSSRFSERQSRPFASAQNLIVIKTLSGCGPAAGEAVDCIGLPHVVGSVAGDNTLLLIIDKEEHVEEIMAIFNDMLIMRSKRTMINHISINNFAIIENTEIDFEDGLNIITGETGSGKSIVIEAISLALGSRADSAFVRHGASKAVVQLAGELNGEDIVITREVSAAGKNLCRLNGQLVTLGELSETCHKLADIHGQYDNQSLLNAENHIRLVDSYHGDQIKPLRSAFDDAYQKYHEVKSKLNKLLNMEADNLKKMDFYRFEKSEIDKADLTPGEDEELAERISLLQNSEKIFAGIETAYGLLNEGEASAMSALGGSLRALQGIAEYSKEVSALSEEFADMYYRMEDISSALRDIREKITFTPEELDQAISRLDLIENLKKKYGSNVEEIFGLSGPHQ